MGNRLLRGCQLTHLFSSRLPFKAGLVKSFVRESEQSPRRQEALFAAMVRNASRVTGYFRLPSEQVVEIGRQISIKEYAILNRGAKARPQRA